MELEQENNYLWSFKRELEPHEPLKFLQQASEREENFYLDTLEALQDSTTVEELDYRLEAKVADYLPDIEEAYAFRRYIKELHDRTATRIQTIDMIEEIDLLDTEPETPHQAAALGAIQGLNTRTTDFEVDLQHHYEQIADSSDFQYRKNFEEIIEKLAS